MAMNDLTSGFNIGKNISFNAIFSEMVGVNEIELHEILNYFIEDQSSIERVTEELKLWYNGYSLTLVILKNRKYIIQHPCGLYDTYI